MYVITKKKKSYTLGDKTLKRPKILSMFDKNAKSF